MSDPERRLYEQMALARYPYATAKWKHEPFVEGAMFAANLVRKERQDAADDAELRDRFAMAALNALCNRSDNAAQILDLTRKCWLLADAMMEDRSS